MASAIVRLCTNILIGVAAFTVMKPVAVFAADATGIWLTEDGRARVRTERCGPGSVNLCGYVVWGSKPLGEDGKPKIDRFNPDAKKQARPILGHQMILGLKPNEDGRFVGKIYNGDNGKSYDVTIWSEAPTELSVKGCLLAVLCQTQTWKRVTDLAPGQLQAGTNSPGGPQSDPEWISRASTSSGAGNAAKGRPANANASGVK